MGPGGLNFGFGANGCRLARGWNRRKRRRRLTVFGFLECECKLIPLSLGAKSVHNETPSRVPYLHSTSFVIKSLGTRYYYACQ
jgi:hypothetical protein